MANHVAVEGQSFLIEKLCWQEAQPDPAKVFGPLNLITAVVRLAIRVNGRIK